MPNRIRALREARNLPLENLARQVGTSSQQISYLETGKRRLTVYWMTRLGKALNCHPWELVGEGRPAAMDAKEIHLLEAFRRLPNRQRQPVLELIESLIELAPESGRKA